METQHALIEQYELVKEIHYSFDGIEPKIIGRIYKITLGANAKFMWDINYHCRLVHEASVYIPGGPFGNSSGGAENKLDIYIKRFEQAVEWKRNESF